MSIKDSGTKVEYNRRPDEIIGIRPPVENPEEKSYGPEQSRKLTQHDRSGDALFLPPDNPATD